MNVAIDPHCRIGRVKLKGSRSVAQRLPLKLIQTSLQLQAAIARASIRTERAG